MKKRSTKKGNFTRIELFISVICQIGVSLLYYLKKIDKNHTSLRPSGLGYCGSD